MLSNNKNAKSNSNKKEFAEFDFMHVTHVHDFGNGSISFNADFGFNGKPVITIYGLTWREGTSRDGKEYKFVSMPQEKGKDGNYYNRVYFPISDLMLESIEKALSEELNK